MIKKWAMVKHYMKECMKGKRTRVTIIIPP
jgi:hypothetical protein